VLVAVGPKTAPIRLCPNDASRSATNAAPCRLSVLALLDPGSSTVRLASTCGMRRSRSALGTGEPRSAVVSTTPSNEPSASASTSTGSSTWSVINTVRKPWRDRLSRNGSTSSG
jgi:hypothetical protein